MRKALAALLLLGTLAAPALATDLDPGTLVLRSSEIPAGFTFDRRESGVQSNEETAGGDRRSRALVARLGRVTGYQAQWGRDRNQDLIVSRADVFRARAGTRTFLGLTMSALRTSGIKGLRRSAIHLGDEGYLLHGGDASGLAWVVWRSGRVVGTVVGWGVGRETTLALARKQQRRIAATVR